MLENGILDMFMNVKSSNGTVSMKAFYNNYVFQNSFFIKGYAAIGPSTDNGSFISGASFYWVNSVEGNTRVSMMAQSFQTANNALQLPYVLGGLGRANNYV